MLVVIWAKKHVIIWKISFVIVVESRDIEKLFLKETKLFIPNFCQGNEVRIVKEYHLDDYLFLSCQNYNLKYFLGRNSFSYNLRSTTIKGVKYARKYPYCIFYCFVFLFQCLSWRPIVYPTKDPTK